MSEDGQISIRSEKTRTVIAMLTIISCMIPCEIIKADKLKSQKFEEVQEFDNLYQAYCCQPQTFNKFTSYLKNSKLFLNMRRPHNQQSFRQLMFEQDNFFVESALIRYEYTYFVCFNMLPEHA